MVAAIMNYKRLIILFSLLFLTTPLSVFAAKGDIYIIKVADAIGPGVAGYVIDGLETAAESDAACVVIQLDTPGGLADSMREIVQAIYRSPVPVAV